MEFNPNTIRKHVHSAQTAGVQGGSPFSPKGEMADALAHAQILPGAEWSDGDLARAKEFLLTHSGHPLEELSIEADHFISEKHSYSLIVSTGA